MEEKRLKMQEDLTPYIEIDWDGICAHYDLDTGDISPSQLLIIESAQEQINEVLNEYVKQNQP